MLNIKVNKAALFVHHIVQKQEEITIKDVQLRKVSIILRLGFVFLIYLSNGPNLLWSCWLVWIL